jgi:hypothetical protein
MKRRMYGQWMMDKGRDEEDGYQSLLFPIPIPLAGHSTLGAQRDLVSRGSTD